MKKIFIWTIALAFAGKSRAQLTILPVFDDKIIAEETWFVSKNGDSILFENIRFYLSNFQFEMQDGTTIFDPQKAHLVDVFDAQTLKIALPKCEIKNIKKIRFNIGIDSLTNVSGALGGDLDPQNGMYWSWQSGYINLKIEGKSPQSKARKQAFQFHIGGYLPPFNALKTVELDFSLPSGGDYTGGGRLKVEISKFFENLHLASQYNVMIPSREALELANNSVQMFSIEK
ncbi:MAG: hypothetical protein RL757_1150 [Bacteroidota bacterium]|jgi:hypothetical protein